MPTPSHRPIPVSLLTILFLLAGCPWDVPGMSPLPLQPQIDPDPGIQPSPSKISVSSGNGAVPARAFSSPFPAGSGAAPAPMGGAGMSESHPEFGGLRPGPLVPMSPLCRAATLNPRQLRGWSLQEHPGSAGTGLSLEPSRLPHPLPGLGFAACSHRIPKMSASHPVSATSCTPGLGTRSGHPGHPPVLVAGRVAAGTGLSPPLGLMGRPGLTGSARTLPQVETKAAGAVPCPRCPPSPVSPDRLVPPGFNEGTRAVGSGAARAHRAH